MAAPALAPQGVGPALATRLWYQWGHPPRALQSEQSAFHEGMRLVTAAATSGTSATATGARTDGVRPAHRPTHSRLPHEQFGTLHRLLPAGCTPGPVVGRCCRSRSFVSGRRPTNCLVWPSRSMRTTQVPAKPTAPGSVVAHRISASRGWSPRMICVPWWLEWHLDAADSPRWGRHRVRIGAGCRGLI